MNVPITGGTPTTLLSAIQGPFGVAVDATSVYWISDQALMSVPIAGGAVTTLVPPNLAPAGEAQRAAERSASTEASLSVASRRTMAPG
jgi:hypothetical protein